MLQELYVSNVALIEEARLAFGAGLNILSGETGAGKSILIDALGFALGARADKELIRNGAQIAVVEALFSVRHKDVIEQIKEIGVEIEDDGAVFLHRSYTLAGKSVCKVNGKTITLGMLRDVCAKLIDVHGQHEHQSLLSQAKHIQLLDRFCQDVLFAPKRELAGFIEQYKALQKDINNAQNEGGEQLEFYRFQLQEIEAAKLDVNEEEELLVRRATLANSEKIRLLTHGINELDLAGAIKLAAENARKIAGLDETMAQHATEIEGAQAQIIETAQTFVRYGEKIDHDPAELDEIEARLDTIYKLKQKYKMDTAEILDYAISLEKKFDDIENSEKRLAKLAIDKKQLEKEIGRVCLNLSKIRQDAALKLGGQIENVLKDLGMENAQFVVEVSRQKVFGANGFDRVEFMICANKGGMLAPLSRIASGGEMSRVMLALKTVLASFDTIESFIFDEIDTGLSGRTAQQVAQKMAAISRNHQILCITHLPQIAAMGDINFLIEKSTQDERTITSIHQLGDIGVVEEIARLIGGAEITDITLKAAREMRKQAVQVKS